MCRVLCTMPAKLACDSALGPMDVLTGLSQWCSFVLYETDDQENVETWSAGFRHRNCDKDTLFGNQIVVGAPEEVVTRPFLFSFLTNAQNCCRMRCLSSI